MNLEDFTKVVRNIETYPMQQLSTLFDKLRQSYEEFQNPQHLSQALYIMTTSFMKIKGAENYLLRFIEKCLYDVIDISLKRQLKIGSDALRQIFINDQEYYKQHKVENSMQFPIGKERPIEVYQAKIAQQCDVIRPYITSTNICGWTRCTYFGKEGNQYNLQYWNASDNVKVKQKPIFAPLGTRALDIQWRANLQEGNTLDVLDKRAIWRHSTIIKVQIQNQCKKVLVAFRIFDENGDMVDSQGKRFIGLGSAEDQWLDVASPRLQIQGKMRKKGTKSAIHNQYVVDDHYDLIFEKQYNQKPFYAIMRMNVCKSSAILQFFNRFIEGGGLKFFSQSLTNPQYPLKIPFNLMMTIMNSCFLIPHMALEILQPLYFQVQNFVSQNAKHLNNQNTEVAFYFLIIVGKRILSFEEREVVLHNFRKTAIPILLKQNLEKRLLAIKLLYDLVHPPLIPYTQQQKTEVAIYCKKNNIFYEIYQAGVHDQILFRSVSLLKTFLDLQVASWQQLQYLWNIVPISDLKGRQILEKFFAELVKTINIKFVQNLLEKLLNLKEKQLTIDNLNVLREIKNRNELKVESRLKICYNLWDVITVKSNNISTIIEEQAEIVFKGVIALWKDQQIKFKILKLMSNRLKQTKILKNEIVLMKDYILTYPKALQETQMHIQGVPVIVKEVVMFLKEENIYDTLLSLIKQPKNSSKLCELLYFMKFLFDEDDKNANINSIAKVIYQITGPSQIFLTWAQTLSPKLVSFFVQLFQKSDVTAFVNLTLNSFNSLKNVILKINVQMKNIKINTTTIIKTVSETNETIVQGPIGPVVATGPATSINQKPQQKNEVQTKIFIYVLTSPFNVKGMKFLEEIMVIAKDSKVQQQAIKFMISLFVNLDKSLLSKTFEIRYEFLMSVMSEMEKLNQTKLFSSSAFSRMQGLLNLIQQIFEATQDQGLGNVKPHIQHVVGELMDLDIENGFKTPEQHIKIKINSNVTVWSLKKSLAQITGISPFNFDLYKYQSPISGQSNGKTLNDILYNGQGVKLDKKKVTASARQDLLNGDKTALSAKFDKIVQIWYNEFKTEDGINAQGIKRLSEQRWRKTYLKDLEKINDFMKKYDTNSKGYVTLEQFKKHFIDKAKEAAPVVWRILLLAGYKNNLRNDSYQEQQEITILDENTLPRKILSNEKVYEILFSLLGNQAFEILHTNIYHLLSQLQTDRKIKELLISGGELDIVGAGHYKLSYYLDLINWLMAENMNDFYEQFLKNDGCTKLLKALQEILKTDKSIYDYDNLLKEIVIPNILKTINVYYIPYHLQKPIMGLVASTKLNSTQLQTIINKLWVDNCSQKMQDIKPEQSYEKLIEKKQIVMKNLDKIDIESIKGVGMSLFKNLSLNYKSSSLSKIMNQISKLISCLIIDANCNLDQFILYVKSQNFEIRRIAAIVCYLNCNQYPTKIQPFMSTLIKELPTKSNYIYADFFTLFKKLLEKALELPETNIDFVQLAETLFIKILTYEENEKCDVVYGDKLILGLLVCLNIILQKKQQVCKQLIKYEKEIMTKCLFFYGASERIQQIEISEEMLASSEDKEIFPDYFKCKSDDSRKILYEIVEVLHKQSVNEEPKFYSKYVMPIINQLKQPRKLGYRNNKVGLYNYGSTCYANSMLQVLNLISPFRNSIMMAQIDDPLIKQFKKMFAFLFFSQRTDYAPKSFFQSFSQPINLSMQQDTTQFLNFLADNLERVLKNSPYQHLLNQIFKGSTSVQMICHSCGAKRQRKEQFFTYDVDIEGKYDLKSALEGMLQGEVISDCLCQTCNTKSDTTKRSVLSEIPNVFFLHLRRIVFNYDVFMNTKIHTRLEFPEQINIEPYTKQGIDLREKVGIQYLKSLQTNQEEKVKFEKQAQHGKVKDYYKLKLKGVIIHSGTGNAGHYFSLVEDGKSWVKLNDSRVQSFSLYNLQSQCFGGTWTGQQWGGGMTSSSNAYVLIYQRIHKDPITIGKGQQLRVVEYDKFKTYNTSEYFREVWLDNHQLLLQSLLLHENYCKDFIRFTSNILKQSPSQDKMYIISELILKVCLFANHIGELEELFLSNTHQITEQTLRDYILADKKRTFKILIHHEKKVRNFYSTYIQEILIKNYREGSQQVRKEIIIFIEDFLTQLHADLSKNWLYCGAYFKMFDEILIKSIEFPDLYQFFLKKDLISKWIDFVMEKASPVSISYKKYSLGNKASPVEFTYAINSIEFLVKRSYGFDGVNRVFPTIPQQQLFHLSKNDIYCLSCLGFYEKMMKQRQNLTSLAEIIKVLSFKNLEFSQCISRILLKTINQITDVKDKMIDLSYLLGEILSINDQFWLNRAQSILGFATPYIFKPNLLTSLEDDKFVYVSLLQDLFPIAPIFDFIIANKTRNPVATTYLIEAIFKACLYSEQRMLYLICQAGPSILHRNYIDVIKPFIETVISTSGMDKKKKQKKQKFENEVQKVLDYIAKIEAFTQTVREKVPKPIIIGDIKQEKIVKSFKTNNLIVTCKEIIIFGMQFKDFYEQKEDLSKVIRQNKICKELHPSSNVFRIFKSVKPSDTKPKTKQEAEIEEAANNLFEDDKNSKQDSQSMQIQEAKQEEQMKAEQQELPLVNIKNIQTINYLYEIEIQSQTHQTIDAILIFNTTQSCNAYLPLRFTLEVPQKGKQSFWLSKKDPMKEWGTIDFQVAEKQHKKKDKKQEKNWFRTYEHEDVQTQKMDIQQPMIPKSMDIQCPACTYVNPPNTTACEICQTPLG